MGTKERLARSKEKIKKDILIAAMDIVKKQGCQSLSMRKIADTIEYSAPVIYSYFLNKEAVEIELAKQAYDNFNNYIADRVLPVTGAEERFKMIGIAFLEFTSKEKELYQLILSTGMGTKDVLIVFPGVSTFMLTIRNAMDDLINGKKMSNEIFQAKYLTFVALIMGLAFLNNFFKNIQQETNDTVIEDALSGIISSLKKIA